MSTRTTTTHACPTTTTPTYLTPSPPSIMHTHLATTAGMSNFSTSNVNDNRPTTNTIRQHTTLLNTLYTQAESISWRLRQYCIEAITANSRRRRRRRDDINNNNNYSNSNYATSCSGSNCIQTNSNNNSFTYSTPSNAALPDADYYDHNNNNSYMCTNNNNNISSRNNRNLSKTTTTMLSSPVIQVFNVIAQSLSSSSTAITYITALLVLTTLCSFCAASPCDRNNWWDPLKDKCIPCTVCKDGLIPLRPCQFQCDTICGSIYDLKIDWLVLAKTEPNWKERRKDEDNYDLEQQLSHEELQQLQDGSLPMDWQTMALFMAVLACLIFFIIAAGILVHHMRQWRRMERRLDQDVEELSTKLMAKLAEVQSMEGGTFFIGNADALGVSTNFQPQHVLLPEKPAKHHERRILKTLQPGNVYIEENGSKG
ncbi:tumor necrosis factor receptor superfamily member wengen [Bactrocera oleae]|uniref:tumor necrosis factor receptor superfamily member wengen n=1 Tax=Bactrocera oleae TaxID=104688 RepID=UPI00387E2F3F